MKFYIVACGDREKCPGHAMRGIRAAHLLLEDGERGDEFEPGFYPGYKCFTLDNCVTPTGLCGQFCDVCYNCYTP